MSCHCHPCLLVSALWLMSLLASLCQADVAELVEESIRANPPQTPSQRLVAVENLLNVGRGPAALEYLQPLADAQLTDQQLEALNREFGTTFFFRLIRENALDPVGTEFANTVFTGAARAARNPQRVRSLVEQLVDANRDQAAIITEQLLPAGSVAAATLLTHLAHMDEVNQSGRGQLIAAMGLCGSKAVPVLEAGIDAANPDIVSAAIVATRDLWSDHPRIRLAVLSQFFSATGPTVSVAAQTSSRQFYGPDVNRHEIGCWLADAIEELLEPHSAAPPVQNEKVWWWSEAEQAFRYREPPRSAARYCRALRLAKHLLAQHAWHPDARSLHAVAAAGLAKRQAGLATPLDLSVDHLSAGGAIEQLRFADDRLSDSALLSALHWSLTHGTTAASLGLIELCARRSADAMLASPHSDPSPLAEALRHPNRRIRWAAAEAISTLDPKNPFKGSCDLPSLYKQFLTSQGERVALVIDPNRKRADWIAGNLTGLGYSAIAVRNGKEAMRLILANPDIELTLLSAQTYAPRASELLQELRHDYRARRLPLALLHEEFAPRYEALADRYDNVVRFPHPFDFDATAVLVRRLVALADEDDLTALERQAVAQKSLQRLADLSAKQGTWVLYDLNRVADAATAAWSAQSLRDQEASSAQLIALLANLGTPDAQQQLLALSADQTRAAQLRIGAARGLQRSIKQVGFNLSAQQTAAYFSEHVGLRQNESSTFDEPTRLLLRVLQAASLEQLGG